ncbi:acetyl/propionyl/methylcrotonyl-CoA carboxylase subunit alpha [Paracoccus sp. JM45]|uniref:acetyl/propionyl/methylcrotonyl-CoA carboxylase subunit alpha n=1 Tax=Paracoccus sp. JM45 TaxID=2283626 RepID=UPI000E6C0DC9|nr:acetyl/propionyl/methylcrotonyl-CoA carboxylase subunit alpha [Paracoccus sp. JM45]RJE79762.1 acetyl/propionyl/methylcrotonyl-CoA carboxylase subunit alpha [Paracoccus sp. JM45]
MFDKILIANRGEIACRVIDTCRRLGVATVTVYSDADRLSRHVAMADQAVHLGGPAPADSYLRGQVIIDAASATGAQAIHPGYGFLSENPGFVDQVAQAGLIFIGPSAAAIRAMGLKDAAKALMEKAGVPVVPGYHGDNQDTGHLAAMAGDIGYPVLIKAVAGGGGKGMRRVDDPAHFDDALQSARSEAQTAFGNPDVLIEKYVLQPRHIEVQVFGDGKRAVHLFERDCSLQRRHQKVIEEAPAPGMTAEMRQAMGDAAVRAAEAIGYSGAGTIEFIVDGSDGLRPDRFWFMEMNTRLQVEHPVTEAITGVDLVEWQLRVASGEDLPVQQDDLSITGHAFEARLYAEDVPAGFLPATGRLVHLGFPDGARIETGVRQGDVISPWYDPMIAKVITWGATRATALRSLESALVDTDVAGLVTNLDFLIALTRHHGFRQELVDTGLIGRDIEGLTAMPDTDGASVALGVIGLAGVTGASGGMTLWQPLRRTIVWDGGSAVLQVMGAADFRVTLNHSSHDVCWQGDRWWVDGHPCRQRIVTHDAGVSVFGANTLHLRKVDPLYRAGTDDGGDGLTRSPMPGLVKSVHVTQGQQVRTGDRLCVLEAMKMEHSLLATRDGIVAEVLAKDGDQVEAGAALIRLDEVAE